MDITIPELSRDTDRGQVGIETLIIFIAMILVAAIAASVLINTAGYLQNQASATSEDSEAQVSNQVLVLSSIGEIHAETTESTEDVTFEFDNSSSDILTYVDNDNDLTFSDEYGTLIVNGSSTDGTNETITDSTELDAGDSYELENYEGGQDVDVYWEYNGTRTHWTISAPADGATTNEQTDVPYDERINTQVSDLSMTVMQSPGANEIDLEGASVEYIGPDGEETLSYAESSGEGVFAVEGTTDPDGTAPVLTSRQDRFTLQIELSPDSGSDLRYLNEGEEATVRIVTQSGSQAVTIVNVPQSLSSYNDGDAVEV